jgi:predicted hydrocarbon binding protein
LEEAAKMFGPMFMQMYATMGKLCNAFYEKFGDEALPIIAKISGESGAKQADMMKGMLRSKDMKGIGEMFKMWEMMGMKFEIVEVTEDKLHFKSPKCLLGIENTSRELCETMMTSDTAMMNTLLGKEVEMKILKSVAAGDEYCEVIFKT